MKKHVNIPVFIPHLGCPNLCVFCNQRKISGHQSFDIGSVSGEIENALKTIAPGQTCQIAYFGGSFTGIPRDEMVSLLEIAKKYIDDGRIDSVRLSTRPDYIDREILDILRMYGVKTIELGLQSMKDSVLEKCKRGHSAEDGRRACALIKQYGFELIGQMMTGLPGSEPEDEVYTAEEICRMGADGARIYPTVVFNDTELCDMAKNGLYEMPSEEDLVKRTTAALKVFAGHGVTVIRIGLQSGEAVLDGSETYSHTYHPSVGEMCYSAVYRDLIDERIPKNIKDVTVYVPKGCLSKAIGQHGCNREYLKRTHRLNSIIFAEDETLGDYQIKITDQEKTLNET